MNGSNPIKKSNKVIESRRSIALETAPLTIAPIGVDGITLHSYLHRDCINPRVFTPFRETTERSNHTRSGEKKIYVLRKHFPGERFNLFYIRLYKLIDSQSKTLQWYLSANFNPSHWYGSSNSQAVEKDNYTAGNANALRMALEALDEILSPFNLATTQGDSLIAVQMATSMVHITRDLHFGGNRHQRERAPKEVFEILSQVDPRYCKRHVKNKRYNKAERSLEDYDFSGEYFQTVADNTKSRMVCYIKEKKHEFSGQVRLEYRSVKAVNTREKLMVVTVQDVINQLEKVEAWHQGAKAGRKPHFEAFMDDYLDKLLSDSKAITKRVKFPRYSAHMHELYRKLWGEDNDIDFAPSSTLIIGKAITFDDAQTLSIVFFNETPASLDLACREVVGYETVRKTKSEKEASLTTSTIPLSSGERAVRRQHYQRLVQATKVIRNLSETPSTTNTWVQWSEQRDILKSLIIFPGEVMLEKSKTDRVCLHSYGKGYISPTSNK